jgi:hypothetical protein
LTDVRYEAGEIVAQCGLTVDVYAAKASDVTIGGRHVPMDRLVAMFITEDGLAHMRLALVAGDRLKIRQPTTDACVALVCELAEVYTVDTDQVRLLALVQQARDLTGYGKVKTGEQP